MAEVHPIQQYHRPKSPHTEGALALQSAPTLPIQVRARGTIIPFPEQGRRKEPQTLREYMEDFSTNYAQHKLPKDWYQFNGIGFSMKSQMGLLENEPDAQAIETWTQQTSRDIL